MRRRGRGRGCLEIGAIVVFALVLGAFAASTLHQHLDGDGSPTREPTPEAAGPRPSLARARIRVEVRNGSGIGGAAARMTTFLRGQGFDVVDFGNADRMDHGRTHVLDRSGRPALAREVAAALQGVPVQTAPDSTLFLDVTVMIGRDLARVLPPERPPPDEARGGWREWLERVPRPWR